MTPIRKPPAPIRRNVPVRGQSLTTTSNVKEVDEVSVDTLALIAPNLSVATLNGFFGEKPDHPSLIWELSEYCAKEFVASLAYLFGRLELSAFFKVIEELTDYLQFIENNKANKILTTDEKKVFATALHMLCDELSLREAITNNKQMAMSRGYAE
jgi:hypothetical protein